MMRLLCDSLASNAETSLHHDIIVLVKPEVLWSIEPGTYTIATGSYGVAFEVISFWQMFEPVCWRRNVRAGSEPATRLSPEVIDVDRCLLRSSSVNSGCIRLCSSNTQKPERRFDIYPTGIPILFTRFQDTRSRRNLFRDLYYKNPCAWLLWHWSSRG